MTITVVATITFWLVITSWRPWTLFDRGGFSSDFYDEQARVFLRGRLAVDPAVPGPEGFVVGGRTYLYYGPFLSIVRMPLMLFGDLFVARLVRVSLLIAFVVLLRWSARLARAGRRVVESVVAGRPLGDDRWAMGLFTAAVACSPALYAAGWVSVYHETELWALTLAVIGLTLIAEWAAGGFARRRPLVGAIAAAMAATLTRAPIGVGVSLGLIVCGSVLLWRSRADGFRDGRLALIGGIAPFVAHALVNVAKFGTLTSVPGDQQLLSLTDPTRAAWFAGNNGSFFSLRFLPTTIAQYLRPDAIRFERLIPGVRFGPLATDRGSYPVESITPAASIITTALLLLVLAAFGGVWLLRHRGRLWLLLVVATTIGAVPTFMIGFIANRYLIDMLPPLIAAGAVGVWIALVLPGQRILRALGVVLVAFGVWVNASLATWGLEYKTAGFTELRYDVDRAVFGGVPPALVSLDPGMEVPRDGVVAVDPRCLGVYMSEQGRWVALERALGTRRFIGTMHDGGDTVVLAEAPTWSVRARDDGDEIIIEIVDLVDQVLFDHAVDESRPADYVVIVDPVTSNFYVVIGDSTVFLPPEFVPERVGDDAATSDLCVELTGSLSPGN